MPDGVAQLIYLAVAGVLSGFALKYMTARTGGAHAQKLAALGLSKAESAETPSLLQRFISSPGSEFLGSYKECDVGYSQGHKARFSRTQDIETSRYSTSYHAGYEYWAQAKAPAASTENVTLSITERQYPTDATTPVPSKEVRTGHAAFDERFAVRCEDPDWALSVLGTSEREALMAMPVVCIFVAGSRVYFTLVFSPDAGKALVTGGGMMVKGNPWADQPELFLDLTVVLARRIAAVQRQAAA